MADYTQETNRINNALLSAVGIDPDAVSAEPQKEDRPQPKKSTTIEDLYAALDGASPKLAVIQAIFEAVFPQENLREQFLDVTDAWDVAERAQDRKGTRILPQQLEKFVEDTIAFIELIAEGKVSEDYAEFQEILCEFEETLELSKGNENPVVRQRGLDEVAGGLQRIGRLAGHPTIANALVWVKDYFTNTSDVRMAREAVEAAHKRNGDVIEAAKTSAMLRRDIRTYNEGLDRAFKRLKDALNTVSMEIVHNKRQGKL